MLLLIFAILKKGRCQHADQSAGLHCTPCLGTEACSSKLQGERYLFQVVLRHAQWRLGVHAKPSLPLPASCAGGSCSCSGCYRRASYLREHQRCQAAESRASSLQQQLATAKAQLDAQACCWLCLHLPIAENCASCCWQASTIEESLATCCDCTLALCQATQLV